MIELLNIDCMEYMSTCKDKQFDLAIVDPPYGIGADTKNSGKKLQSQKSASLSKFYGNQNWDLNIPDNKYFDELYRVSKHQIIWGANYCGIKGGMIYWRKNVTMPTYSSGELAYCSLINRIIEFEYTWHGMLQNNMSDKEERIHPTQKPVQLYKWLLKNYARPDMKIIDTHGGSMSIAIACYDFGCDLVCCEIDKDYYDAAVKRFENYKLQTKIQFK